MRRENWDDLRFVAAVAEAGTLSGAARRLGVTHGTVLRRIAAYEEAMGHPIFDKSATGYALLPEYREVLSAVHEVEAAVLGVGRMLGRGAAGIRGQMRITSTDTLCHALLPRVVGRLAAAHPELQVTLVSANTHLDFGRAAVDVTLRPADTAPEGLWSERVGALGFVALRARDAAEGTPWLRLEGPLARARPARWLAETQADAPRGPGADSFLILREMVRAGLGQSFLPDVLRAGDDLVPVPGAPALSVPLWLACQPDLAESPRVRAVLRVMAEALRAEPAIAEDAGRATTD